MGTSERMYLLKVQFAPTQNGLWQVSIADGVAMKEADPTIEIEFERGKERNRVTGKKSICM